MLPLRISASSGVPIYLQLEQQIKHAIASGLLSPGDPLISTRRTAAELRINPNTVARAFQNLEREGVIRTVPGGGTFVGSLSAVGAGLLKAEKIRRLRPIADQLATEAAQLLLSPDEVHKLLDAAFAAQSPASQSHAKSKTSAEEEEA